MISIFSSRKSLRLKNYDYSQNGLYYVTICTRNREEILSEIKINSYFSGRKTTISFNDIIIVYTKVGNIILSEINNINQQKNILIHNYVIMPNHIHFIIQLNHNKNEIMGRGGTLPLQTIIGRFKSFTTKQYNILSNSFGIKLWQRNYYEHIIRDEKEYLKIIQYIQNNPFRWIENKHHL